MLHRLIDYKQWQKWEQGSGVYIITLEKKNSALEPFFYTSNIDTDLRNTGIPLSALASLFDG